MSVKVIKSTALIAFFVLLFFGGTYEIVSFAQPFEPPSREYQVRYELKVGKTLKPPFIFKYYLYTPKSYSTKYKYPLVVLLHGASRHMKSTGLLTSEKFQAQYPTFVLVPIAPNGYDWGNPTNQSFSAFSMALTALENTQEEFSIDADRIYLSGYSMGGYGTFAGMKNHADIFAASMPLCAGWNIGEVDAFSNRPMWIFHGAKDTIIPPSQSRDFYAAAKQKGLGNIQYTEIKGIGHNVWDKVYNNPKAWFWLLSQKRQ